MIREIEDNHLLSITSDKVGSTQMLRDGNVCLGMAKYKNNVVSLWLKKNADIELIEKENVI